MQSDFVNLEVKETKIKRLDIATPCATKRIELPLAKVNENTDVSKGNIKETPKEARHLCPACEKSYTTWHSKRRHIKNVHKMNPDQLIRSEGKPLIRSDIYNADEPQGKNESSLKTLAGSFRCTLCLETYKEIHDLQDHVKKAHPKVIQKEDMEIVNDQSYKNEPDIQSKVDNNDESQEENMKIECKQADETKKIKHSEEIEEDVEIEQSDESETESGTYSEIDDNKDELKGKNQLPNTLTGFYKCHSCPETFIKNNYLQGHIKKLHPAVIENEDLKIETEQQDETDIEHSIYSGIDNEHESLEKNEFPKTSIGMNPYKYKCGSCLETYIEIHDLQDHIEKEHPEEIEDQEEDMEIESEQPDETETEPDIQSEIDNNDESMEKNMIVETEQPDKTESFHMTQTQRTTEAEENIDPWEALCNFL